MVKYYAELNREEVIKFTSDFYEVESCRGVKVIITPNSDKKHLFNVFIESEAKIRGYFLERSFKDGLMCHWGWNKKFNKIA